MSAYTEIELRCDGVEGDPFGCDEILYDGTAARARAIAKERGWRIGAPGGKDFCPKHRARPAAEPTEEQ